MCNSPALRRDSISSLLYGYAVLYILENVHRFPFFFFGWFSSFLKSSTLAVYVTLVYKIIIKQLKRWLLRVSPPVRNAILVLSCYLRTHSMKNSLWLYTNKVIEITLKKIPRYNCFKITIKKSVNDLIFQYFTSNDFILIRNRNKLIYWYWSSK